MNTDEKTCPECAETIKAAAKVCKHCGHRLEPSDAQNATAPSHKQSASTLDIFHCPSCKKPTPEKAGKCRHCGNKFTSSEAVETGGSGERKSWAENTFEGNPKPLLAGCGIIALMVGGLLLSQCVNAEPEKEAVTESSSSESHADNFDQYYAAQQNLKAMLKDGDAAKFEGLFLSRIGGGNLGTSIYRWQNVAWDDSLLPDSGGSRCVNRDFSDYRII